MKKITILIFLTYFLCNPCFCYSFEGKYSGSMVRMLLEDNEPIKTTRLKADIVIKKINDNDYSVTLKFIDRYIYFADRLPTSQEAETYQNEGTMTFYKKGKYYLYNGNPESDKTWLIFSPDFKRLVMRMDNIEPENNLYSSCFLFERK